MLQQVAIPDIAKACHDCDILVFVLPHQFLRATCKEMVGNVKPHAMGVSLIKVFDMLLLLQHLKAITVVISVEILFLNMLQYFSCCRLCLVKSHAIGVLHTEVFFLFVSVGLIHYAAAFVSNLCNIRKTFFA